MTMKTKTLVKTDFNFKKQTNKYIGKVRDVYTIDNKYLVMIATDRISAFDVVMPYGIPYKGQVLNQMAEMFLDSTEDIVPNWKIASPDPMVTIGYNCKPYPIEMIVRGYLTGSSWRAYKKGKRQICGVPLPDGLNEHQKFDKPILTPTTKAELGGHDENISKEEIIKQGLVSKKEYEKLEHYAMSLFNRGTEIAEQNGLILVDTKYEFGKRNNQIFLIDEVHTADSSRYFYLDGYENRFMNGESQKQLSKEFLREWLMQNNFEGKDNQKMPDFTDDIITMVSERYIELFEKITNSTFEKKCTDDLENRVKNNIESALINL